LREVNRWAADGETHLENKAGAETFPKFFSAAAICDKVCQALQLHREVQRVNGLTAHFDMRQAAFEGFCVSEQGDRDC
jgi:hypothetical protein